MEPLVTTIHGAMKALGFGRTKTYKLIDSGTLERIYIDGSPRITMRSVRAAAGINDDAAGQSTDAA